MHSSHSGVKGHTRPARCPEKSPCDPTTAPGQTPKKRVLKCQRRISQHGAPFSSTAIRKGNEMQSGLVLISPARHNVACFEHRWVCFNKTAHGTT